MKSNYIVKIYACVHYTKETAQLIYFVGNKSLQKLMSRINAPLSRQPLVKGERLVRGEVSAAMLDRQSVKILRRLMCAHETFQDC